MRIAYRPTYRVERWICDRPPREWGIVLPLPSTDPRDAMHEHDHVLEVRSYLRGVADAQAWFVDELGGLRRELASVAAELEAWRAAAARRPTNVQPR